MLCHILSTLPVILFRNTVNFSPVLLHEIRMIVTCSFWREKICNDVRYICILCYQTLKFKTFDFFTGLFLSCLSIVCICLVPVY